jgi:hypothetical protein
MTRWRHHHPKSPNKIARRHKPQRRCRTVRTVCCSTTASLLVASCYVMGPFFNSFLGV